MMYCVMLYGLLACAIYVYVCLFVSNVFVRIVCDLLCDVVWFACFLAWLRLCVCYVGVNVFVLVCDVMVWCCMVLCGCVVFVCFRL